MAFEGGGTYNAGALTVVNSTITANIANESGGGLYNYESGNLSVTNSTISANEADEFGGGIYSTGTLAVTNSTIATNTAGESGGGIHNGAEDDDSDSNLTLIGSTLSENSATDGGGLSNSGNAVISNSTISGNSAINNGGGIFNNGGVLFLTDPSEVSDNLAEDISIVLMTAAGDGGLSITVDAFGAFGSSAVGGNALFDPVGDIIEAGTTFESGVAIREGDTGPRTFFIGF